MTILLAEDDADLRDLLQSLLEKHGSRVVAVPDGNAARDVLEGGLRPDALVTDVRMPRLSGIDVLRSLRRAGDRLPVILITAFGEAVDRSEIAALGPAAVIEKPFDLDDLRTALHNLELLSAATRTSVSGRSV